MLAGDGPGGGIGGLFSGAGPPRLELDNGGNVRLTGTITEVRLGYPYGELTLDVDGAAYTVEVGQPWRNQRAGLGEGDFAPGRQITVQGEVASDPDARVLKVERLWIDGERYELYPERD